MFSENDQHVVLIRKNKPQWQAGKLNGVGGHIEGEEYPLNAMIREFEEETGVTHREWEWFAQLKGSDANVFVYRAFSPKFVNVKTTTDEEVNYYFVDTLRVETTVPNLKWLIPLALQKGTKFVEASF
jgi:8-oxo-dGTP diphosphatase